MSKTHVLGLSASNYAATQREYPARVDEDRIHNDAKDRMDAFAGKLTSSFYETFHVSGTIADHVGGVGGEFFGGLRYNPGPARHITEVLAFQRMSGTGGFTRVDVWKDSAIPTVNESIFSADAYRPVFTGSDGDGYVFSSKTFAPSSSSWAAGELLGVEITEAPLEAMDLTVMVGWKPSGSYA